MRGFGVVLALLGAMFLLSCASATIRKVPNRSDYDSWSDGRQREVDAMDGLRFYRSRPYVVVHEPFPVESKTYLVDAMVSDDGELVRIIGDCPKKLGEHLTHVGVGNDFTFPACMVWLEAPEPPQDNQGSRSRAKKQPDSKTVDNTSTKGDVNPEPSPRPNATPPPPSPSPLDEDEGDGNDDSTARLGFSPTGPIGPRRVAAAYSPHPDDDPPTSDVPGQTDLLGSGNDANKNQPGAKPPPPANDAGTGAVNTANNANKANNANNNVGLASNNAGGSGDQPVRAPGKETFADETTRDEPTGTTTVRLSTSDKVYLKKLNNRFDLIYLPDLEEEYVVDPKANLGDLDVRFTKGPGGVLMAMGMDVDNSAITRPLVDVWGDWVRSGGKAVDQMIAPGKAQTSGVNTGGGSGRGSPKRHLVQGSLVTLRIHVISFATPGLYPILKAKEVIDDRTCMSQLSDCSCPACLRKSTKARDLAAHQHVVPVYPYSRVAYQVHRKVVVERLIPRPGSAASSIDFGGVPIAQSGGVNTTPPPAKAQSTGVGAGTATGITNAALLRQINGALRERCTCVCARILFRNPGVGTVAQLTSLKLLVKHKSGRRAHAVMLPTIDNIVREHFGWGPDFDLVVVNTE